MRKLLSVLTIPFSALTVLSGAIGIPLLLMKPFFSLHIRPLQLCSQSGLTSSRKNAMIYVTGELSEWLKEPVLKTGDSARNREFESHTLRQKERHP